MALKPKTKPEVPELKGPKATVRSLVSGIKHGFFDAEHTSHHVTLVKDEEYTVPQEDAEFMQEQGWVEIVSSEKVKKPEEKVEA